MDTLTLSSSPSSLSPGAVPSSHLSVSALAPPPVMPQTASPSTTVSSLFFILAGSPYPPASSKKLCASGVGVSSGKQSASLWRATVVGVVGGDGKGVGPSARGVGASGSLGDLKFPARISEAQGWVTEGFGLGFGNLR
ncbi:hypothetical protein M413DRAFT_30624 [Hebeloma cylindrosporum]|uniref:Uncharacterized protein n=1 Tax=Hebeloma cylindrosporum TaxID=76867 RepID=A0A0C2XIQ1_HEBCY|nr:hypothetical protein M413DRAFT_30624 [Hebeloma cylindrosporum h7]